MSDKYQFQEIVSEAYLADKDILLCAPTGSGKTRASVAPALYAFWSDKEYGEHQYPPRMIFVAPLKTLVKSQYQSIEKAYLDQSGVNTELWEREWKPSLQTGDDSDDPLFERKIILATVDQLLASFLNIPYGISRRMDNINTGAVLGSYLIFDELHLYPYDQMFLTVLAMLKLLKGVCRFTLMTATLSQPLVDAIVHELDMRLISDQSIPNLFDDVKSLHNKTRTWHAHDVELTAEQVKSFHQNKTLCICNTVERAQKLYEAVKDKFPDIEIMLLHSRFIKAHRSQKETRLLDSFEKSPQPMIIIATQVVEVGLDISADTLLTECAPASSLIQRAGRCARRENQHGHVHVFRPPYSEDKKTGITKLDFLPYSDGDQQMETISNKTWDAVLSEQFNGQILTSTDEQMLVNLAHGEADEQFAESLHSKIETRMQEILECMAFRDDSKRADLIRKQTTVPLYIPPNDVQKVNEDEILTTRPHQSPLAFSLSRGQIAHFYENAVQGDADFILMGCTAELLDKSSDDMQTETRYLWKKVMNKDEIYKTYRWFVAHPKTIGYNIHIGLHLDGVNGVSNVDEIEPDRSSKKGYFEGYTADLYHEHIAGLYGAYTNYDNRPDKLHPPLRDEFLYPLHQLCKALGKDPNLGERLMRLTIALHDVGKLNVPWQKYMVAWQHFVAESDEYAHIVTIHPNGEPFAHSDNRNLPRDFTVQFKHAPRGNHAVESAEACHKILLHASNDDKLWRNVAMRAIMHHHTPTASEAGEFTLIPNGKQAIAIALHECDFSDEDTLAYLDLLQPQFRLHGRDVNQAQNDLSPNVTYTTNPKEVMLYYLFVRILRLADQRSIEVWHHYLKKARS